MAYQWILDEDPPETGTWIHKVKILGDDNKIWPTKIDVRKAAEVELVTDIACSDSLTGKFDIIMSGGSEGFGPGMPETSSHIKNSDTLYGMNVGCCDGHVEWRRFKSTQRRWRWEGGGPWWWW
jgi:hypothetical protein